MRASRRHRRRQRACGGESPPPCASALRARPRTDASREQLPQPFEIPDVVTKRAKRPGQRNLPGGCHVEARRGLVHRWCVLKRAQRTIHTRLQQRRDSPATTMSEVTGSRVRRSHPLCPDEPFDIRHPQLDGLQRQVRGARRGEAARHVNAQRIDVTQPSLDGSLAPANDRLDHRGQSRCGWARALLRAAMHRISHRRRFAAVQPCTRTERTVRRRRPAPPLPISLERQRAVSAITVLARALTRETAQSRDCRGRMQRNRRRGRSARRPAVVQDRSLRARDIPSPLSQARRRGRADSDHVPR